MVQLAAEIHLLRPICHAKAYRNEWTHHNLNNSAISESSLHNESRQLLMYISGSFQGLHYTGVKHCQKGGSFSYPISHLLTQCVMTMTALTSVLHFLTIWPCISEVCCLKLQIKIVHINLIVDGANRINIVLK